MIASRLLPASRLYATKKHESTVCVTFIDDDGNGAVTTKIMPMCADKGVPFVLAMFCASQGFSTNQGLYMQNAMGFEIASHSYSHVDLRFAENLQNEVKGSKDSLIAQGYNVTNLVYPYGGTDSTVISVVQEHYNSAILAGGGGINERPITDKYRLNRVALGSFTEGFDTLEYYKAKVDEAITKSAWLIFMTHCGATGHDTTQQGYLEDTIEYIKTKGVSIVTLQRGYELFV